jgi:hypothetical protein
MRVKAIIEIDLEIEGEWEGEDSGRLEELILENPHFGAWEIDDRLVIFAKSWKISLGGD